MKKVVFLVGLAVLLFPSLVLGISLMDYQFPESSYQELYLDAALSQANSSGDSIQISYSGLTRIDGKVVYRSLPFEYAITGYGSFNFERGAVEGQDAESAYDLYTSIIGKKYLENFHDGKLFGFGEASGHYRKLMAADEADDPRVEVLAGAGYGRVIDATVLARAIRINEDLKKFKIIDMDIPDDALIEMAQVIEKEDEFRAKHGPIEYKKYYYDAVVKVLRDAGVLKQEVLPPMGVIRIEEILDPAKEPMSVREHGWVVRAGVGALVSDYDGEAGDPYLKATGEYTRPLGIRFQFSDKLEYATVFEDDPTHNISNTLAYTYELSNRIDWYNTWNLAFQHPTADGLDDTINNNLSSTFRFYIANLWDLAATFTFTHSKYGDEDADWNQGLSILIRYRLR
ncbi:MAG: hypothetical protein AMJ46_02515 [Latescibacteria bacterium DG_63]|nr:MAG: hypothetical protein AMJ46_02515 [Latescibacteria bacterium DG_63]